MWNLLILFSFNCGTKNTAQNTSKCGTFSNVYTQLTATFERCSESINIKNKHKPWSLNDYIYSCMTFLLISDTCEAVCFQWIFSPVWAPGAVNFARIDPMHFLTGCHNRRLNQRSWMLCVCFVGTIAKWLAGKWCFFWGGTAILFWGSGVAIAVGAQNLPDVVFSRNVECIRINLENHLLNYGNCICSILMQLAASWNFWKRCNVLHINFHMQIVHKQDHKFSYENKIHDFKF